MEDDLTGNIDQPSTHRRGIGIDPHHWGTDIFLERFEQEMTYQHRIIPGSVRRKPLKGQLLMAEILQRPVGQFVAAAFVITGDQPAGRQIAERAGVFEKPVDGLTLPEPATRPRLPEGDIDYSFDWVGGRPSRPSNAGAETIVESDDVVALKAEIRQLIAEELRAMQQERH